MSIAIGLIGGLGLFLFGMNYMGEGLQKAAGSRLKNILAVLTKNKFMGLLVGTLVTMVIQSSSATTVMTVGFVNAGLMNLNQAIGIIMGANIGTTATAVLVTLNLTDLAPLIIGIGVFLMFAAKKQKTKDLSQILIGFGILFLGMELMKQSINPLQSSPVFTQALTRFTNPVLGILVGFVITAILQSSSATTGLLIAVAGATSGLVTIDMAFPIIFGQNIGTCVTAMLSGIGANRTAKQAAVMHLLFNILGTIIFMVVLRRPVQQLVLMIRPNGITEQIAAAHVLFNIINVIILFPFSNLIVKAATALVKGEDKTNYANIKYIDTRLIATPPVALAQAARETLRMGKFVTKQYEIAVEAFNNGDSDKALEVFEIEKKVNELAKAILNFLVQLDKASLTDNEKDRLVTLINSLNDIERVGDHADNIAELAMYLIDHNVAFSKEAMDDLNEMFELTKNVYTNSLTSIKTLDAKLCQNVLDNDSKIDKMYKDLRKNHIERLNNRVCEPDAGVIFLDTISNLERIGDHSSNISISVLDVVNKYEKN